MIRQVAWDYEYETTLFHFDELNGKTRGVTAARRVSDTDILVLAVRDDRDLPSHVRLWLGLCLGMRNRDNEGALVALIVQTEEANGPDALLVDYLETVAIVGGLTFYVKRRPQKHCNRAQPKFGGAVPGSKLEWADASVRVE